MKKAILLIFVFCSLCQAEDGGVSVLGSPSKKGVRINISSWTHGISLAGGEVKLAPSANPLIGGTVSLPFLDMAVGGWIHGLVSIKNGDGKNWKTGLAFGFTGYRNFLLAIKVDLIQESIGFRDPFNPAYKGDWSVIFGLRLITF